MPEADAGTVTAPDNAAATPEAGPLPGFAEGMVGWSDPEGAKTGEPENAEAVETVAEPTAPEAKKDDTPPAKEESPQAEEKQEPAKPVNFDGFSEKQKTTFERLLKAGHVTPDEVEEARRAALRQDDYSRKTAALKREVEKWEKEAEGWKEDRALLEKIRNSDRLHARWLEASKWTEDDPAQGEPGDPVDAKTARKIADDRYEARQREDADRSAKEKALYQKRYDALKDAAAATQRELGVDVPTMKKYLEAEEARLAPDVDPVLRFDPDELMDRVRAAHKAATLEREIASLKEQLNKRTSQAERSSKQSLTPPRRVAEARSNDPLKQTEQDLNIAPDWSNVQGFGWQGGR